MKFPFIDILLKLFWFIVISKIIRFSRYRYYLLWNLAHCYIGIEIPFFYSIYSIFKFYLSTKNITIIIKWIKASVNAFAVLHWITASRFTKRTTSYSSLIRSSSSTTAYRFLQLKPKTVGPPDSSHTNKSIRSCYAALHRITAPQFIKTCLYSSWYKQVTNRCLLLLTLEAGDLLTRLKTISRYRKAHMSCRCCETFFKSSGKKHPLHYCS